jgi:hypothetical protein
MQWDGLKRFVTNYKFVNCLMAYQILILLVIANLFIGSVSAQLRDTSLTVFNDNSYRIKLTTGNTNSSAEENNVVLSLVKKEGGKQTLLLNDSLFCQRTYIRWKDFNNDSHEDLMLFRASSARSNWTYYLYVTDPINKTFRRIHGFEEIANPEFVKGDNVITSYTLTGKSYYSFYRIDNKNRLINFQKSFDAELDERDSIQYERVIKEIRAIKRQ